MASQRPRTYRLALADVVLDQRPQDLPRAVCRFRGFVVGLHVNIASGNPAR